MKLPYGYVLVGKEIVIHEERVAVDKFLTNKKYVPIVGIEVYLDAQYEKNCRCNVDYDKVGHPRKAVRYRSPSLQAK